MHFYQILAATFAVLPSVLADCCSKGCDLYGAIAVGKWCNPSMCADGTEPTPCCGVSGCNVFCCACKKGCRKGETYKLARDDSAIYEADASDVTEFDAFATADVDSSGNVTLSQYLDYMGASSDDEMYTNWFAKHDKDGNGVLTEDELRLE